MKYANTTVRSTIKKFIQKKINAFRADLAKTRHGDASWTMRRKQHFEMFPFDD